MVFHWSLIDCKSLQVSRTLLSVLADFNNTVVWMVSAGRPISNSFSSLTKTLGILPPNAPITVGITVTFIFLSFFSS